MAKKMLRRAQWEQMGGLSDSSDAPDAAPDIRCEDAHYRRPLGKAHVKVRLTLHDGLLLIRPRDAAQDTQAPPLLRASLAFARVFFERRRQKIDLELGAGVSHRLRLHLSRTAFDQWLLTLYRHRIFAQAVFLRGSTAPAPAHAPAELAQRIRDLKRAFVRLRSPPTEQQQPQKKKKSKTSLGSLFTGKSKNAYMSMGEVLDLGDLLTATEELIKAVTLVSRLRPNELAVETPARRLKTDILPLALRTTKSQEHLIFLPKDASWEDLSVVTGLSEGLVSREEDSSSSDESDPESGVESATTLRTETVKVPAPPPADVVKAITTSQRLEPRVEQSPAKTKGVTETRGGEGVKEKPRVKDPTTVAVKKEVRRRTSLPSRAPGSLPITLGVVVRALRENSLPLELFEPLGSLQRLAEQMEYSELLDRAVAESSEVRRLALVTGYVVSSYSSSVVRTGKPFNPMLGESFALDRWDDSGWRFVSEQVSHSPDISACHAEGRAGWSLQGTLEIGRPRFSFTHLSVVPAGNFTIHLVSGSVRETFRFQPVESRVLNLATPEKRTIHHHGSLRVTASSGLEARIAFTAGSLDVTGTIVRLPAGKGLPESTLATIEGAWPSELRLRLPGPSPPSPLVIFKAKDLPPDAKSYYGLSLFARALNDRDSERSNLPPTDSRFRPDQAAFEKGQLPIAQRLKEALEANQRLRKATNAAPVRWFTLARAAPDQPRLWAPNSTYWDAAANAFPGITFRTIFDATPPPS